ncbi:MAG: SDR family oxidoreductase [Syntrophorhabdales bacterium]|jgi:3-oxoacyl-[acyl-carrier protein] reductase
MRLPNKVALITGAASGIGRASAVLFAKEGAKVVVADIDEAGGRQTVDLIAREGGSAVFVKADVTKAGDVERMIKTSVDQFGKLDILFNNAGVGTAFTPLEQVDEALWDRVMAINVKSIFLGCKYAAPVMKAQGGGVIINTASISGVRPRPGLTVYAASKGAVIVFTKAIAIEFAPYKIRVNCINPVVTDTAFITKTIEPSQIEAAKKGMLSTIPLGRLGAPEDMAFAALYLASDEAGLVTGVSLDVDGGRAI